MKEEAKSKKLPPKMIVGGSTTTTPTKVQSDEIFGTLLRINNFDSISSIKDESLDIDLSACVTICADTSAMMNGNSLSSTDFWRVLDESAQNPPLDVTGSDDSLCGSTMRISTASKEATCAAVKEEQTNTFSGNFLRPEPPVATSTSPSPLKKPRALPAESYIQHNIQQQQQQQHTTLLPENIMASSAEVIKPGASYVIKEEPPEQEDDSVIAKQTISTSSFNLSLLQSPQVNTDEAPNIMPSPPQPLYKCLDCNGQVLCGKDEYASHHSASHRIMHKCSMCDREFEQESGLKKHLKTHRTVDSRKDAWKKCPDCGKCLKLGSLWMHRKIHSENKKYGCEICGQKFVQKINLTHHSRVHITEKPYECPECQKRFQERSHLQRHQKYHAQTRSYRCDKCGKMYKTERCLKVHNLVHLEQRPFACNVCNKSFISNSKLKQHSNIHTGNRPFKCNYCPRDFTNFPNWLKHTRRRHKVDHKTGEHLENIPSYCSKKSSKTPKSQKAQTKTAGNATEQAASTNVGTVASSSGKIADVNKIQKILPSEQPKLEIIVSERDRNNESTPIISNSITSNATSGNSSMHNNDTTTTTTTTNTITLTKAVKVKRERKQSTPKQVQKSMIATSSIIKKEMSESKSPGKMKPMPSSFPDLHCLSLTSAEELLMEEALEMEESGFFDKPTRVPPVADTDNAISSESAAALHFQIKSEFSVDKIKEEEFISTKETNNCTVLCSSVETSPYSSPASIDIVTSSVLTDPTVTISTEFRAPTTTYYIPNFALHLQNSSERTLSSSQSNISACAQVTTTANTGQHQRHISAEAQSSNIPLYFPMTMTMPLLQSNQVLPSVDTLFASHASSSNFLRSKSVSRAQHNLS